MRESISVRDDKRATNLRLLGIGLALILIALVAARSNVNFHVEFVLIPALLYAAELGTVWLLLQRLRRFGSQKFAQLLLEIAGQLQVVAELLLLTWVIYYTGGITSALLPVYFVYIFAAGLSSNVRTLVWRAVLAMAMVLWIGVSTYYGWLDRYNLGPGSEDALRREPSFIGGALLIFAAIMAVTLIVAVMLSRRTRQREQDLGETARQLSLRVEQVNTLRDIGQRLASSLELDQVLDAVCESALKIVRATDVHIFLYDQDLQQFSRGVGVWSDGHRGALVNLPRPDGLSAQVAGARRPVIINDAESHALFQTVQARAWALKAIAGFPIIKADRMIAVMNVAYLEPHQFTRDEQESLLAMCDQAAIAIDNARLYQQVRHKIQELSAVNQVSQYAAQLTDISAMLNDALGAVLSAVNADAALVATLDPQKNTLTLAAHRGLSTSDLNELQARHLKRGEGFGGQVVETGEPIFAADVSSDERRTPRTKVNVFASVYTVPLRAYERVIGVLQLLWKEIHPLTPTETSLTGAIAPQLAIAVHNSSLYDETRRRAEELATLRSIGLATTSTLNLREQLRLLYENVNQLLRADTFFVGLYDETREELRIEYAVEEGWFLRPIQVSLDHAGLSAWVIRNQKSLSLDDLQQAENLPATPAHVTRPARSWLGVPLVLKDRVLGLICAQSFQPRAFTNEDERFLIAVAQHVVLALDNARLFAESERRTRELTLLNEISRAISASLDLEVVMERAARALADQLGYRYVNIYELDGDVLVCKASVPDPAQGETREIGRGVLGRVARTGRAAFVHNVETDPDYVVAHQDVVSEICVPVLREGRVLGLVNVEESRAGALKEDDLALLALLSEQLAIASTNASLYREALGRERFATRLGQLGMTVTSTLDVVQLIEILCRESIPLFDADAAAIYLLESGSDAAHQELHAGLTKNEIAAGAPAMMPERSHLVCRAAAGSGRDGLRGDAVERDQMGNVLARTLRLARGFILHDARNSSQLSAQLREHVRPEACLAVPIMKERFVIGVLLLCDCQDAERFGEPELARAAIVASQAALAIENAKLFTHAQERLARINALQNIEVAILSTMNLVDRFDLILEHVVTQMRADLGVIFMRDPQSREVFGLRQRGSRDEKSFREMRFKSGEGAAGWIMEHGQPLYLRDVRRDPRWVHRQASESEGVVSYLGVPLQVEGRTIGVIDISTRSERSFTDEEISFFNTLASHAAVAIENARLYEQTHAQLEQLRETQARLVESERRAAIGELVAGLAHEINNPLTAIVGHSQLLMETIPEGASTKAWRGELDTISVAAQRIARIVQEFMKLSQVEGGHAETINLADVVRHAVQKFEARDDAQDIAILQSQPTEPIMVKASPQLIDQVLNNILTNALEAMPYGGRIDVQAGTADEHQIFCAIRDTGYGIPASDLKRVFEPGFTTKVESGVVRGIGLGLYTAERIIKSYGGAIWLESEEGKYTIVKFALPRARGGNSPDGN